MSNNNDITLLKYQMIAVQHCIVPAIFVFYQYLHIYFDKKKLCNSNKMLVFKNRKYFHSRK